MNYMFFALLSFAGFLSLENEKNGKKKRLFTFLYMSSIAVGLLYCFGGFIGKQLYNFLHV
ncbi:hypothetical protein GCM10009430_25420 [Aquimarina litoralis]|uniref:Uncharacterized protein n=1 Tax=Aquimarina litoralis TaxID=584605 RepID=A0ABN1IWD2_9FLAO